MSSCRATNANPAEIEIPSRNGIISVSFCAMCRTAIAPTLPARPAAEIERLVDAYGRAERRADSLPCNGTEHDRNKARTALLPALATPAPVPADLRALLTEYRDAYEQWLADDAGGQLRMNRAQSALADYARATLPPLATGGA